VSPERKVRLRRWKRRLKAAAALVVAAAAGVFLACAPKGDKGARRDAAAPPAPAPDAAVGSPAPPDASPADAAARADAPGRDAGVDRHEHRKGMPVPDNLLE